MEKKYIITGIAILLVAIIIGYIWINASSDKPEIYSVLKDNSYTNKPINFGNSNTINAEGKTLTIDNGEYFCEGKKPKVIEVETEPIGDPNMDGSLHAISVFDCGDHYWILELFSSGPELFGPFDK